jgi:XTP/dITP diphosphohydrolase
VRRVFREQHLVVASHNPGKVREIGDLLRPFGVATVSAAELGLPEPDETEDTFEGNARLKALAAARASGLPALADDSGLAVIALGGDPGIHSARWAETAQGRDFRAGRPSIAPWLWPGRTGMTRPSSAPAPGGWSGRRVGTGGSATTRSLSRKATALHSARWNRNGNTP